MGMNAHANGGLLLEPLKIPNFRDFAVKIEGRGTKDVETTRILGQLLHAVMEANKTQKNFRVFGPDETASNRLGDAITGTGKEWMAATLPVDENLSQTGRVMEILSEHMCQGWLEGYLLTGRHGLFNCYEAFIHIIDSMANQHAKWLKVTREIPWRKPIASLNYLLSSLVWRQDHNGFSHQDPGFIDHLLNKKADVVRIYLPPDANTLLSVADHCLRSKNYINLIVAGKQPEPQWLTIDEAVAHCTTGLGVWKWASNDEGKPEVVMACSGDVPTLEALAAVTLLRALAPDLRIRVVNVVDLMALQPPSEHPHGLPDEDYDQIFPPKTPVVFAFHGYPSVIHRLTYRRHNHDNLHVRGYKEEGTTTTPFDMCVLNNIDRFQLSLDVFRRVPRLAAQVDATEQWYSEAIQRHRLYVAEIGDDMPEIKNWRWPVS
jgi:xylulose-5-phosphate/fructose-6-phosphate phosphoketolase